MRPPARKVRLANILADMIRSALTWEEENGLNSIPPRIHSGPPSGDVPLTILTFRGESDGDPDDHGIRDK